MKISREKVFRMCGDAIHEMQSAVRRAHNKRIDETNGFDENETIREKDRPTMAKSDLWVSDIHGGAGFGLIFIEFH